MMMMMKIFSSPKLLLAIGVSITIGLCLYLGRYRDCDKKEDINQIKKEEPKKEKWTFENTKKVIYPEVICRKVLNDTSYIIVYTDDFKKINQLVLHEDEITFWITDQQTKVEYYYTIATDEFGYPRIWNKICHVQLRSWDEIKRWE